MPQPDLYRARYRTLDDEEDDGGYASEPQPLALALDQARRWIDSSKAPPLVRSILTRRLEADPMVRVRVRGRMMTWEQWVEAA